MKLLNFHKDVLGCKDIDAVFSYLINNLKDTIKTWSYFVNWQKVYSNVSTLEKDLNLLNYLIGKDDNFENEFIDLFSQYPGLIRLLPILLACRDNEIKILTNFSIDKFESQIFNFQSKTLLSREEAKELYNIFVKSGLITLVKNKRIKNFVDYVIGVEVGLDSNGRKNRSGVAMQDIVEALIKDISKNQGYQYIAQATSKKIKEKWDIDIVQDKTDRQFDFAVNDGADLILIETNFYGGGGSKLKSTAGEYKSLNDYIVKQKHHFIWITDGVGWSSTQRPLRETFEHNDYLFNLDMIQKGALEATISQLHN